MRLAVRPSRAIDESQSLGNSSCVFRKFGNVLMILAVLSATGTHWFALQSVAWTTMLAENLHTNSWHNALAQTFDGKHPCCLCKEIANDKQSEKKSDVQVELKKLEYSYTSFEYVFCPPAAFYEVRSANHALDSLTRAPSVPPPKELLG
jgi:hypothetical protein